MNRFTRYLRRIVYLEDGIDRAKAAAAIKNHIAFRGPNVIILACAIIIAAVGLNVNSIPVIIGAMLISPVMGPIIGFGLGLGTNDTDLLKNSGKNFLVMVLISIVVASLYFLISPLRLNNPTELLARTRPTIYDVLIALFGGVISGFGVSIALTNGASSGGTDFLSIYYSNKYHRSMWDYVFAFNCALIFIAGMLYS